MSGISLLIVDDNPIYSAELEECFKRTGAFRLLPSASDGETALQCMTEEVPDVLVLDMMMPKLDGMGVLSGMRERRICSDTMVFANGSFFLDASVMGRAQDLGVVYFFSDHEKPEFVCNKVLGHVNSHKRFYEKSYQGKQENIDIRFDRILTNYLLALGFRVHLMGYKYIKCAIKYSFDNYGHKLRVVQDIYPYVAEANNTTVKCVERDIRTAIESAWNCGDMDVQYRFFGYTVSGNKGKPTNKEFIAMLTERMVIRINRA